MTDRKTKEAILTMRREGMPFTEISRFLSIPPNTVKSICYRNRTQALPAADGSPDVCKYCGKPLPSPAGKKVFCSSRCRYRWWNRYRSRKPYRLTCYLCGREFISFGNRKKKYCSQECRMAGRHGENGA